MASASNPIVDGSDKKCVESCNLQYGISEAFNKIVMRSSQYSLLGYNSYH